MIDKAVELVGEDMRSGKRTVFGSASGAVGRRIVIKSTALLVMADQHVKPLGHQARGGAGRGAPYFTSNPNGCLGH